LRFDWPLAKVGFERGSIEPQKSVNPRWLTMPQWSATALDQDGREVANVGELESQEYFDSTKDNGNAYRSSPSPRHPEWFELAGNREILSLRISSSYRWNTWPFKGCLAMFIRRMTLHREI
jgi:hypothetical protein